MNRSENDAYWGTSETAPTTLDSFFDEDCDVNWTGLSSSFSETNLTTESVGNPSTNSLRTREVDRQPTISYTQASNLTSIAENVTHFSDALSGTTGNLTRGVGKTIGEKFESWKQPSVSSKWSTSYGNASKSGPCLQCTVKDEEIVQLKKRLETSFSRHNITLPPEDVINRILLGQPFSLEYYRSKEDKLALIDEAIKSMDGSAIWVTVLFLHNTVKQSIFHKEMQMRPVASLLYVSYLKQRHKYLEASEFLGALGKKEDAAILKYKWAREARVSKMQVANLKSVLQSEFVDSSLAYEKKMVDEHCKLLEHQLLLDEMDSKDKTNPMLLKYPRGKCLINTPLLTTLYYLCMYHWDVADSHITSPVMLKKVYGLSEKQFLWTVLRSRARVKHWPIPSDLDSLMSSRGIFAALSSLSSVVGGGSGRSVKSVLPLPRVVAILSSLEAPGNILATYIRLIDSTDLRLKLAVNYKCHQAVIDFYVTQKDRESLEKYMKEIPEGTSEYIKAEGALKNTKWRN